MKNTMIPVVTLVTALTAEYGTVHVCALDNSPEVYDTEHDFSDTSEVAGIQEDEMEFQKAKADADQKQEYLNSVSAQFEHAKQDTDSARQVLEEECERVINDTQNELEEAEKNLQYAAQAEQQALLARKNAECNVSEAEKQLKEAEEDYQKLLDDLNIPHSAYDELNDRLQEAEQQYQDIQIEKINTASEISSLKLELASQYLNLTSLKANRDLKQEALSSLQMEISQKTDTYSDLLKQISDLDERYPDISSSVAAANENKESAEKRMKSHQEVLNDYHARKTCWEAVKSNGVNSNNLMYNKETGYYYKPEDVDSYLTEIYRIIESNTCDYEIAESDYNAASVFLESLSSVLRQREALAAKSNECKADIDQAQSDADKANSEYKRAESDYQNLYQQLLILTDHLDELEKKESDCCTELDCCSNDIKSLQEEIDALNHLKELCDCSLSRTALSSNDSISYADLYKQVIEAKKKKETAKEVLNDASEELVEKKKAEQVACDALKEAEKKTLQAKERYESARTAVLEIRNNGKLTSEEFSYLNKYLLAYNNAVKNENQLRQSYEKAKMEYDIAAGLIAPGSDLYNRHMKYIESLEAYEKLITDSYDVPETVSAKPVENTSVTAESRKHSNEMMAGVIFISSLVFVTCSIMKVKRNRHEKA